jgi:hypothetical protein
MESVCEARALARLFRESDVGAHYHCFPLIKPRESACLITHKKSAGFAGLYSPKGVKRRQKPSPSTSQAKRETFFDENTISDGPDCNPRNPQTRNRKETSMQLYDTWYCHLCGARLAPGNTLCTDCAEMKRKEEETKCKALVAEGKRVARNMNPQEAARVLMGVYEQALSKPEKDALALAAHALFLLDSSKKENHVNFTDARPL